MMLADFIRIFHMIENQVLGVIRKKTESKICPRSFVNNRASWLASSSVHYENLPSKLGIRVGQQGEYPSPPQCHSCC